MVGCGGPSGEQLFETALNGADAGEREAAAVKLARYTEQQLLATSEGEAADFLTASPDVPRLRRLLEESDTPEVRAAAVAGLGEVRDIDSLPQMLDLMASESTVIRMRSFQAVKEILGTDFHFDPHGPPEERAEVIEVYRAFYEQALGPLSPHRKLNEQRMGPLGKVSQNVKG